MDYQRIYNEIIENAKERDQKELLGVYTEKHHVLPKACGGDNEESNLAILTGREHYIAHWLLSNIHKTDVAHPMHTAFWRMSNKRHSDYTATSRSYSLARERQVAATKECAKRKSPYVGLPAIITESKKQNKRIDCLWTFARENSVPLAEAAKTYYGIRRLTRGYGIYSIVNTDARHPDIVHTSLKEQDVEEIKRLLIKGRTAQSIADRFGINITCVFLVKNKINNSKLVKYGRLSKEEVIEIKNRLHHGEHYVDVSKDYSVTAAALHRIKQGKSWVNVGIKLDKKNMRYSKLEERDIPIIRELIREGKTHKEIGNMFGVTKSCITRINCGRSWKHIQI